MTMIHLRSYTSQSTLPNPPPSHRWIHNPDLGLVRALGSRPELGEKHIVKGHKALADLPLFAGRRIHDV
jgi:hypothetical protein